MEPRLVRFEGFERIHLVADVWGDDQDWPVLLMHGGGQTRHAWGSTAHTLARHEFYYLPRGSAKRAADAKLALAARDLEREQSVQPNCSEE